MEKSKCNMTLSLEYVLSEAGVANCSVGTYAEAYLPSLLNGGLALLGTIGRYGAHKFRPERKRKEKNEKRMKKGQDRRLLGADRRGRQ
jgi:hypothetical protein